MHAHLRRLPCCLENANRLECRRTSHPNTSVESLNEESWPAGTWPPDPKDPPIHYKPMTEVRFAYSVHKTTAWIASCVSTCRVVRWIASSPAGPVKRSS